MKIRYEARHSDDTVAARLIIDSNGLENIISKKKGGDLAVVARK